MKIYEGVKDKLPTLPETLKKDLSWVGNTVLFFASPPAHYAKRGFNSMPHESWYDRSKHAVFGALVASVVSLIGSNVFDNLVIEDNVHTKDKQEVAYDSGRVRFAQSFDLEVKNNSRLLKMFLPFERPFLNGTYGIKDRWTAFVGNFNREGLEFTIEGNLPMTTNLTKVTTQDLYKHARHTKIQDTTFATKYALGIKEEL